MFDVPLTLMHFAKAHVLMNQELDAAKAALDSLLAEYGPQASEEDPLHRATALRQELAIR